MWRSVGHKQQDRTTICWDDYDLMLFGSALGVGVSELASALLPKHLYTYITCGGPDS